MWRSDFSKVEVSWTSRQASNCVISLSYSFSFIFSVIYASTDWKRRRLLWNEIHKIESLNLFHILAGDFNCISKPSKEKKGGNPFNWGPGEFDLINIKNSCGLEEINPNVEGFTWSNKKIVVFGKG